MTTVDPNGLVLRTVLVRVLALVALFGCTRAREVSAPTHVRLLSLGDSFTIGTGSSPSEAFPARLAERWRGSGCEVELRNVAVNGYSTRDVIDLELPELTKFHPTFITFAAGANDIVRGVPEASYRANVQEILAAATRAVPPGRVIVLPQPKWSRTKTGAMFGENLDAKIARFDAVLRDEATRAGARFIELSTLMTTQADRAMTAGDGLHPSSAAHAEWADAIAAAVHCR